LCCNRQPIDKHFCRFSLPASSAKYISPLIVDFNLSLSHCIGNKCHHLGEATSSQLIVAFHDCCTADSPCSLDFTPPPALLSHCTCCCYCQLLMMLLQLHGNAVVISPVCIVAQFNVEPVICLAMLLQHKSPLIVAISLHPTLGLSILLLSTLHGCMATTISDSTVPQ